MQYVTLEIREAERVAVLRMNYRQENRLNPAFIKEVMETLESVEKNKSLGALVITGGDPKFFCNGLDLEWMMKNAADMEAILSYLSSVNELFKRLTVYEKPTVAALNGHTFAAGVFLAAHMDFRLMREDRGWVCLPEVDINIPLLPGMIAICQAVMTPQGFRQLYYTGKRVVAEEAAVYGFVDEVCPEQELLDKAVSLAAELGKKRTATYGEMKRRIRSDIVRLLEKVDPEYFVPTLQVALRR